VNGYPHWGAYGVSKAALDQLSRTWAAEVPSVRFLAVDPGEMNTRMHADAMPDADPSRLADPRAVAEAILGYVTRAQVPSGQRVEAQHLGGPS
jgi:NAD(P)-dependent dehydrogenase (short-subunit alcohol dehydrogenase family)